MGNNIEFKMEVSPKIVNAETIASNDSNSEKLLLNPKKNKKTTSLKTPATFANRVPKNKLKKFFLSIFINIFLSITPYTNTLFPLL